MQVADPIASALKTLDRDEEAKEVMQLGELNMRGVALMFVFLISGLYILAFYFLFICGVVTLISTVVSEFWRGYTNLCVTYTHPHPWTEHSPRHS